MNTLAPLAAVLAPLQPVFDAAPEALLTWAPIALAVLLGVGAVGTAAVVALAVVLAKSRRTARA
ncbi:MAG: hypothetical protein H6737_20800 [Alphaproteobacteria bacterium]|nr:hypothetical protein [Alphaproteobacteria bacterium]